MKPIRLLTPELLKPFRSACSAERLFGSRSLCAHTAGTAESFYLAGDIPAALSLRLSYRLRVLSTLMV